MLKEQVETLSTTTKGVLEGSIERTLTRPDHVQLKLWVAAPALNYKHLVLSATYRKRLPYPVTVAAECYKVQGLVGENLHGSRTAANPEAFQKLLREILVSPEVEAVLLSLIARSNDPSDTEFTDSGPEGGPDAEPGMPESPSPEPPSAGQ